MKMSKAIPFALSALLVGSATAPVMTFAKEDVKTEVTSDLKAFIKVEGTIEQVEENEDMIFYTLKGAEEPAVLAVTEDTLLFDNNGKQTKLEKGDKVSAYTDADKPMTMIYPPQYNADVVIVETGGASTAVAGIFNDELEDPYLKLKLNIEDTTNISSVSDDKVEADDLKDQDLLVFYTETTRSIPAQTTPEKVIMLDGNTVNEVDEDATVEQIIENDHYMVEDVKMVPLRLLAEKLGYVVDSTGVGATVYKGASSYTITRETKKYGYNKSLMKFEASPELLEPKKTYVPVGLIEEMMK